MDGGSRERHPGDENHPRHGRRHAVEFGLSTTDLPLALSLPVAARSKERVTELRAIRDQARADAERAWGALDRLGPSITPQTLNTFAMEARKRMRIDSGGYRWLSFDSGPLDRSADRRGMP